MQRNRFRADRQALSPVVGIVIVVGMAVLAVGLGGTVLVEYTEQQNQPQAPNTAVAFDYDFPSKTLTITHAGGDPIDSENVEIRDSRTGDRAHDMTLARTGTFTNGDELVSAQSYDSDETIHVVWTSPDGTITKTLGTTKTP